MQAIAQRSFFQAICGLLRWSEDASQRAATRSEVLTEITTEVESLEADWKLALIEKPWPKTCGSEGTEWSDYIPEPEHPHAKPPGQLDMFLHIVKNSPDNTLSEKARTVMKGIRECGPAKLQEIHNKFNPFSDSTHKDGLTQIAIGSWAALIVSLGLVAGGSIPEGASELMSVVTGSAAKAAVVGTIGKIGMNALLPEERWLARAETIPNHYMETYLKHASRKIRNEVVKERCQAELIQLGTTPKKDLPAAMARLPKFYGRNILEIMVLDQKTAHMKIGLHEFPKDFLEAMPEKERERVIHPDTSRRLHLPKKPPEGLFM